MKFSIKDFFSKCDPDPQFPADLVTFTDKILNGKLQFLCSRVSTAMVIIFLEFLMFYQIFLSPQVKRSLIIINKLAHTSCLTSYRTTQDLRKLGKFRIMSKLHVIITYNHGQNISEKL